MAGRNYYLSHSLSRTQGHVRSPCCEHVSSEPREITSLVKYCLNLIELIAICSWPVVKSWSISTWPAVSLGKPKFGTFLWCPPLLPELRPCFLIAVLAKLFESSGAIQEGNDLRYEHSPKTDFSLGDERNSIRQVENERWKSET